MANYNSAYTGAQMDEAVGKALGLAAQKGAAGGLAELDAGGKVPSAQLPSYVDDVLEYAALGSFLAMGEAGKIYVALDTNKTYRWSGSAYVEISQGVTLGETSSTAYRGDRGKVAYDHSQTSGNAHGLTLSQLGAAAASDVTALQASQTVFVTAGTAPAFTVDDASVIAYAAGLRRTVQFHAASAAPTLNFNGKGAKALYEYTGKTMSVGAGQVVEVYCDGTSFFGVSVSGGLRFPDTPTAGDTTLYDKKGFLLANISSYAAAGAGWGIEVKRTGVYRFFYAAVRVGAASEIKLKIQKNGVDVSNSEVVSSGTFQITKTIDVSLTAGDIVSLWRSSSSSGGASYIGVAHFAVSILAADIQAGIDALLVPTTS